MINIDKVLAHLKDANKVYKVMQRLRSKDEDGHEISVTEVASAHATYDEANRAYLDIIKEHTPGVLETWIQYPLNN